MPLPWKKARFSRLVADHLHSPKHGGSLVVETGFPTSLIDLFVKNHDRLKKPSKKSRRSVAEPASAAGPIPAEPFAAASLGSVSPAKSLNSGASVSAKASPSHRFASSPMVSRSPSSASSPAVRRTPVRSVSGSAIPKNEAVVGGGDAVGDGGEVADAKGVFVAIFKVFFVVVLAMGTKQLAVGITVSAFSLLFLEFAGKYLCRLLKQCQHAQKSLRTFIEQVLRVTRMKNDKTPRVVAGSSCSIEGPSKEVQIESPSSNFIRPITNVVVFNMEEPQITKPNAHLRPPDEEIRLVKSDFGSRSFHVRSESEESGTRRKLRAIKSFNRSWFSEEKEERKEVVMKKEEAQTDSVVDQKSLKSRSGKIRSEIMKFVPKKLWSSKKKQEESQSGIESDFDDMEDVIFGSVGLSQADGVADHESLRSRSSRIKAKIKKLVPKKHWSLKKKQADAQVEVSGSVRVDEPVNDYDEGSSSSSSGLNDDQAVTEDAVSSSAEPSEADMEDNLTIEDADSAMDEKMVGKDTRKETRRRSSYVILLPIVLVGLMGGRFWAIAFTLIWCSMLKLDGMLWKVSG